MSRVSTDLVADLRLGTGNLRRDISQARGIFGGLSGSLGLAGGAGLRALSAIGAAVGVAVSSFANADEAARGLRAALEANGQAAEGNYERMIRFSEAVRNSTRYSAAFVQSLQAMAVNLGVSAEQVDSVVQKGIGLGERFFGGNAVAGVKAASLAVEGNVSQLQRMIPALRSAHTEAEKLRIINEAGNKGFEEAKKKTGSLNGSLALLSRSYFEASAAVGSAFAPEVQKAAVLLEGVADRIKGMTDAQKAAIVTEVKLAAAVAATLATISKTSRAVTGLTALFGLTNPVVGALAVALVGVGALFVNLTGKGETFGERLNDTFAKMGPAFDRVTKKMEASFSAMTDAVVMAYFEVLEVMGQGKAEDLFTQYIKDTEYAAKIAAETRAAETKKGLDKEKDLYREGARERKTFMGGIAEFEKQTQEKILKYEEETAKKGADAKKKADRDSKSGAGGGGVGGDQAGAGGGDQMGPTPDVMERANAARLAAAEKDRIWTHKALERVGPNGDPTTISTLQARKYRDEAAIRRGGAPKPYYRNGADETNDEVFNERDRAEQTGLPERDDKIRDALARHDAGKKDPALAKIPDTPDAAMRRGLGMDPKVLGDAAAALKISADKLADAAKNQRVVGVVKD